MGSGSYSYSAYACLSNDRGYTTKSAMDAVGLKMLLDITKSFDKK